MNTFSEKSLRTSVHHLQLTIFHCWARDKLTKLNLDFNNFYTVYAKKNIQVIEEL